MNEKEIILSSYSIGDLTLLIKNGYEIFRIKWKNPINDKNKDYIKREIEKLELFLFDTIK